ncbi:hypothetical protein [Christiangramia echinicola]|uniref:hypothetical protein n=1 Tax=Christiangramia echinicola TaxID=279359 RepID=UPI00041C9430|nr:hypothetical protein [Christiangramia echinicola]
MKLIEFLLETKLYIGTIFEIIAALFGLWFLRKSESTALEIKLFVYYLVLIVFLEIYAYLPIWAYLEEYEILGFYKDSPFRRNVWWANILKIITTLCVSWIYIKALRNHELRRNLIYILLVYPVLSIISFFTIGEFFNAYDPYVNIIGTFIILISVGSFYVEILRSDRILTFYGDIRFYISFGMILWSLCMVPLDIYSSFFSLKNPLYIELHTLIHRYASIFLYSLFSLGFYMDYRMNRNGKGQSVKNS